MDQKEASFWAFQALNAANLAILNNAMKNRRPQMWAVSSKPYLRAIAFNDYGLEDPVMCVLYALNNMTAWRGEQARMVKAKLNAAIAEDVKK